MELSDLARAPSRPSVWDRDMEIDDALKLGDDAMDMLIHAEDLGFGGLSKLPVNLVALVLHNCSGLSELRAENLPDEDITIWVTTVLSLLVDIKRLLVQPRNADERRGGQTGVWATPSNLEGLFTENVRAAMSKLHMPLSFLLSKYCGTSTTAKGSSCFTLLHHAVLSSNPHSLRILHWLIDKGASLDKPNRDMQTPLQLAEAIGKTRHAALLASAGLDASGPPVTASELKLLLLLPLAGTKRYRYGHTLVAHFAAHGLTDLLQLVLQSSADVQVDVDASDYADRTPLMLAAEGKKKECVKALITRSANVSIADCEGNRALHWAAFGGCVDCVSLILAASSSSEIDTENQHGLCAAAIASNAGHSAVLAALIDAGSRFQPALADKGGCCLCC